jgi:hypothetical protein
MIPIRKDKQQQDSIYGSLITQEDFMTNFMDCLFADKKKKDFRKLNKQKIWICESGYCVDTYAQYVDVTMPMSAKDCNFEDCEIKLPRFLCTKCYEKLED